MGSFAIAFIIELMIISYKNLLRSTKKYLASRSKKYI